MNHSLFSNIATQHVSPNLLNDTLNDIIVLNKSSSGLINAELAERNNLEESKTGHIDESPSKVLGLRLKQTVTVFERDRNFTTVVTKVREKSQK